LGVALGELGGLAHAGEHAVARSPFSRDAPKCLLGLVMLALLGQDAAALNWAPNSAAFLDCQ